MDNTPVIELTNVSKIYYIHQMILSVLKIAMTLKHTR